MRTDTAVGFCTNDLSINELALVTRQTKYLNTTCPPVLQSAVSPTCMVSSYKVHIVIRSCTI